MICSKNLFEPETIIPERASFSLLKLILGYSSLDCFIPIIPPERLPLILMKVVSFKLIIGVSIKIVPPFIRLAL